MMPDTRAPIWRRHHLPLLILEWLLTLPSWREEQCAFPCHEHLAERFHVTRSTIWRALSFLADRGELEWSLVLQGRPLPGRFGRAFANCNLLRPGPAMRARLAGVDEEGGVLHDDAAPVLQDAAQLDLSSRSEIGSENLTPRGSPPTPPATLPDLPKMSTVGHEPEVQGDLETSVVRYYATASGRLPIPSQRPLVVAALEDMAGNDEQKLVRVRAVIDDAVAECAARPNGTPPTLGYVFTLEFFRRRLQRIAEPAKSRPPPPRRPPEAPPPTRTEKPVVRVQPASTGVPWTATPETREEVRALLDDWFVREADNHGPPTRFGPSIATPRNETRPYAESG